MDFLALIITFSASGSAIFYLEGVGSEQDNIVFVIEKGAELIFPYFLEEGREKPILQ